MHGTSFIDTLDHVDIRNELYTNNGNISCLSNVKEIFFRLIN